MGAEATCTARFKRTRASGKARLETGVLHFRGGDLRLAIPFKQMSKVAARATALTRMAALKARLKPNGALWVIRPKGRPEISESAVMAAGKAANTAEKFVIRLADR
jgi:hypothetical protein